MKKIKQLVVPKGAKIDTSALSGGIKLISYQPIKGENIIIELTPDEAEQYVEEYKNIKNVDRLAIVQYIREYIRTELNERKK